MGPTSVVRLPATATTPAGAGVSLPVASAAAFSPAGLLAPSDVGPLGSSGVRLLPPLGMDNEIFLSRTRELARDGAPFNVDLEPHSCIILAALTVQHTRRSLPGFPTLADPSWTNLVATT
jgi:hypothetical protein